MAGSLGRATATPLSGAAFLTPAYSPRSCPNSVKLSKRCKTLQTAEQPGKMVPKLALHT